MSRAHVYLAGASCDYFRAREWAEIIRAEHTSLELVSTWHDTDPRVWAGNDAMIPRQKQQEIAGKCLREIFRCDVFWLLWSSHLRGALVELGYAIDLRKQIVITGSGCTSSVFTSLANYRDLTDSIGYREIVRAAIERRDARDRYRGLAVGGGQ